VGETFDQVRDVMIFGDSGILACSPPDRRPVWQATRKRLVWPNGAQAQAFSAREPENLRGPQFDAAWVDELGCAAIDKGTNQPNKFVDPKSSESSLPRYSTGRQDELMQMQYLRAMLEYWEDESVNPVSSLYDGSMVDTSRSHIWAWDARPFPHFPNNLALWSDGANYARGHWLNGRVTARALASIVAEICDRSGVTHYDVSRIYGFVRGYSVNDVDSGRAALQPLMLAHGFDAIEREGCLHFVTRDGRAFDTLDVDTLALNDEQENELELARAPSADVAGRMRVNFVDADGEYEARSAEAVFPDDDTPSVSTSELELSLTRGEGRMMAERWLTEARIARDTAKFALPPSQADLGAGDVVRIGLPEGNFDFRIDHVEEAGVKLCSATRVDEGVYVASHPLDEVAVMKPFTPVAPVFPLFLDLPLMTGDEIEHAPHIAVTADPWPGAVEVVSSVTGTGYQRNVSIAGASVIGVTETPLLAAKAGLFDRGEPLRVRVSNGHLSSVEDAALRAGANLCAIGDGTSDQWELFQFAQADLVEEDVYELSQRLRGQLGSDGVMPAQWPAGSYVVLMNGMPDQISLPVGNRDTARYYRIGPVSRSYDDDAYIEKYEAFQGVGLRPLSPAHLRGYRRDDGDLAVHWTRRTRLEGDSWSGFDVPLAEASELYVLRVIDGGSLRREVQLNTSEWVYPAGMQAADGVSGVFEIEVAQVSERFGPGLYTRIEIND
ncbi:MAG: glycoside hydrolase TIM-barrel-like domain-containing protein, partial [Pseudomonadota bacterium]